MSEDMSEHTAYMVVSGYHSSLKETVAYVEHIVYGSPDKVTAVDVGRHFVALVEWIGQPDSAAASFDRMGSFPHGASLSYEKHVALLEFGAQVYRLAPGSLPRAASATTL